jgi:cyclophilin family peptidyl-prolyl cis-trans isomerase
MKIKAEGMAQTNEPTADNNSKTEKKTFPKEIKSKVEIGGRYIFSYW